MATDLEIRPRAKYRIFSANDKARILAEYEAASLPLERAAIMRRCGVYSSLFSNWANSSKQAVKPSHSAGGRRTPKRLKSDACAKTTRGYNAAWRNPNERWPRWEKRTRS